MPLDLSSDSRVLVDLRAAGLLRAVAHDPTLSARPEALSLDVSLGSLERGVGPSDARIDVSFVTRFAVSAIEPPTDLRRDDREKMRENLCGSDVLDGGRFPKIELFARYAGTADGGTLAGDLVVRGARRPIAMPVRFARIKHRVAVQGSWEGRLTDLGIKPYKALLGAIRLDDWVRLRLEARFEITAAE